MAKSPKRKSKSADQSNDAAALLERQSAGFVQRQLTGAFGQTGLGAILLWLALPPTGWWPLAFVAPVSWVMLIRRGQLPGKRPYLAIWLAGFLFWLAELYWMAMPHPSTAVGWVAASAYLAALLALFIGLSRVAVHRLGISVVVAAPIVWMGLELVRGHLWGGFTMASLAHAIYPWTAMIQTADLAGAYGVGALIMFLAACCGRQIRLSQDERRPLWPAFAGVFAFAVALSYGYVRMGQIEEHPVARVALIQGSTDITLGMGAQKKMDMHREHWNLTGAAVHGNPTLDLVMWPESTFYDDIYSVEEDAAVPSWWEGAADDFQKRLAEYGEASRENVEEAAEVVGVPLLVGLTRRHFEPRGEAVYNSAVLATRSDKGGDKFDKLQLYDKVHLVMFGEYFPFADKLRFLYQFTPVNTLSIGLQAGKDPVAFQLNGLILAPNICYESVVPQVIRRQVNELAAKGQEPDILVNLSNDGWFFGSNALDLHMICGLFRAVECRKPFLIAANTGLSAWIDGNGKIRELGPRLATTVIVADVSKDGRSSLYLWWGDLIAWLCLLACLVLGWIGWRERRRKKSIERSAGAVGREVRSSD